MVIPDLLAGSLVERVVSDLYVDSRHESFVETSDAICGEEEDALEVIEGTEEDYAHVNLQRM
jgi:hypothetical protein